MFKRNVEVIFFILLWIFTIVYAVVKVLKRWIASIDRNINDIIHLNMGNENNLLLFEGIICGVLVIYIIFLLVSDYKKENR